MKVRTGVPDLTAMAGEMEEERVARLGALNQPPAIGRGRLGLRQQAYPRALPPNHPSSLAIYVLHSADHVGLGGPSGRVVLVVRQHDLPTIVPHKRQWTNQTEPMVHPLTPTHPSAGPCEKADTHTNE